MTATVPTSIQQATSGATTYLKINAQTISSTSADAGSVLKVQGDDTYDWEARTVTGGHVSIGGDGRFDAGMVGVAASPHELFSYASGSYVHQSGYVNFTAMIPADDVTIDSLIWLISAGAATNDTCEVFVCDSDTAANGYMPTTFVGNTISVDTETNAVVYQATGIAADVEAGRLYWLGLFRPSTASLTNTIRSTTAWGPRTDLDDTLGGALYTTGVGASLPANFSNLVYHASSDATPNCKNTRNGIEFGVGI